MKTKLTPSLAAVFCLSLALPAAAQEKVGPDTYAMTLDDVNTHPATSREARRTVTRIEKAALAVCGAPEFSLREVTKATRASDCWHQAMTTTIGRINNPLLTQTFLHRNAPAEPRLTGL